MEDCLNPAVPVQLQCEYWNTSIWLWKLSQTRKWKIGLFTMPHGYILPYECWTTLKWEFFLKQKECCFCKHRCLNINQSCAPILLKYLTIFWLSLTVILMLVMKGWCQACLSVPWETAAGVTAVLKSPKLFPSVWWVLCECEEQSTKSQGDPSFAGKVCDPPPPLSAQGILQKCWCVV